MGIIAIIVVLVVGAVSGILANVLLWRVGKSAMFVLWAILFAVCVALIILLVRETYTPTWNIEMEALFIFVGFAALSAFASAVVFGSIGGLIIIIKSLSKRGGVPQ